MKDHAGPPAACNGITSRYAQERALRSGGRKSPIAAAPRAFSPTIPLTHFADRYRVEHLIGEGPRKQTYLAWDPKARRQVALAGGRPGLDAAQLTYRVDFGAGAQVQLHGVIGGCS